MKNSVMEACTAVSRIVFGDIALADKEQENLPQTAVSMEQAIKAVTDKFPGRVIESELEAEDRKVKYEINAVSASGHQGNNLVYEHGAASRTTRSSGDGGRGHRFRH